MGIYFGNIVMRGRGGERLEVHTGGKKTDRQTRKGQRVGIKETGGILQRAEHAPS